MLIALLRKHSGPRFLAALVMLILLVFMNGINFVSAVRWGFLAGDFVVFYSSAQLLVEGNSSRIYDLDTQLSTQNAIMETAGRGSLLNPGPMAYPAAFMLPVVPLLSLALMPAYIVWTALNLILTLVTMFRLRQAFQLPRSFLLLFCLGYFPLLFGFVWGQVSSWLLVGITGAYLAWRARRDVQSGLWLSLLMVKPQYLVLPAVLLLWKRQWRALGALAVAGVTLVGLSFLLVGPRGAWDYLSLLTGFTAVHGLPTNYVQGMNNWRGLAVNLLPAGAEGFVPLLIGGLSLITSVLALLPWRSLHWNRIGENQFAALMLSMMSAVLITAYHSHLHSLVLLLPPALHLCSLWAKEEDTMTTYSMGWVVDAALLGPSLLYGTAVLLTGHPGWPSDVAGSGTALILFLVVLWIAKSGRKLLH